MAAKASKKQVEAFGCDPDFCPRCGSILPLPGLTDVVSCSLCDFKKDTTGKILKMSIVYASNYGNLARRPGSARVHSA